MTEGKHKIVGQQVGKTLHFRGEDVKEQDIAILRIPCYLEEAEFNILKKEDDGLKLWAKRLLFIAGGTSISIISKVIVFIFEFQTANTFEELRNVHLTIQLWEIVSVGIFFVIIGALYSIGHWKKVKEKNW